jgi:hypothetical protein
MTASDWFFKFFTHNMIDDMVRHTNEYATSKGVNRWTKVTSRELQVWLGLTIEMGIHKLPSLKLYWSTEWLYAVPQFKAIMSRHHYQQKIKSHLFFSKLSENYGSVLGKVHDLLNQFHNNCMEQFWPLCDLSIDEMMIKTKSSYAKIKVRIPTKLIRDGIKVNALCNSKTRFLYAFHVYIGLQTDLIKVGSKTTNLLTTLVNKLLFKRFHIFLLIIITYQFQYFTIFTT